MTRKVQVILTLEVDLRQSRKNIRNYINNMITNNFNTTSLFIKSRFCIHEFEIKEESDNDIIWCWSIKDPVNILYIFRGHNEMEIEIDLRKYKGHQHYSYIRLTQKEKVFLNQLTQRTNIQFF